MCCPVGSLPADTEMKAAAGMPVSITGINFTEIVFIGEPTGTIENSNENNGNAHKIVLSFTVAGPISYRRHAWVVVTNSGATYLIGSPDSVPSIKTTDTTAGAGTKNACEVTIELDSFCSWVNVGDVLPTYTDGGYVAFQDWRQVADATYSQLGHTHTKSEITDFAHTHTKSEITDFAHTHTKSEITDFAHRHDTDEVDDENFDKSQNEVNQQLLELAYAGL